MKDRPTVLIFTDMDSINTASALKEEMLIAEPDAVVIIIDALELYADTLKDFVEKVFGIPANLKKRLAHLKEKLISRHVDDVGVYDNVMKPKESYKRMLNIVNRYMPGLVVSVGFGAFTEAVAVRDSGKTEPFRPYRFYLFLCWTHPCCSDRIQYVEKDTAIVSGKSVQRENISMLFEKPPHLGLLPTPACPKGF